MSTKDTHDLPQGLGHDVIQTLAGPMIRRQMRVEVVVDLSAFLRQTHYYDVIDMQIHFKPMI